LHNVPEFVEAVMILYWLTQIYQKLWTKKP